MSESRNLDAVEEFDVVRHMAEVFWEKLDGVSDNGKWMAISCLQRLWCKHKLQRSTEDEAGG